MEMNNEKQKSPEKSRKLQKTPEKKRILDRSKTSENTSFYMENHHILDCP
jgi:hypothetical protein